MSTFRESVSALGAGLKAKLAVHAVSGEPEEQLRPPIEAFLTASAAALGFGGVAVVGEVKMPEVASRPDFAVDLAGLLVGFVEVKALGKGADPRRFKAKHDVDQFERLRLLPNVLYTDGQQWSLWQNGERIDSVLTLDDDVETAGASLTAPVGLESLLYKFFSWAPIAPKSASELASASARLCRFLREDVEFELTGGDATLKKTAKDWRHLLFPDATDNQFADGYAQAVTFGLLIAQAKGISLEQSTDQVAKKLGDSNSLIGRALLILGDAAEKTSSLIGAIDTMKRVFSAVKWQLLERGNTDAWLYFYEHFLAEYDPDLRKKTGSYYTPPEVVRAMTNLADEALRDLVELGGGLAEPAVRLIDPAMGTGTYLLEVLRVVAERYAADYGTGGRGPAVTALLSRVIGFEIQLGPFAVAQLRLLAELESLGSTASTGDLRTYVADTLSNPYQESELFGQLGQFYEPIAASRRAADKIKRDEQIMVVLGNPPYKEKAAGLGGWIETGGVSGAAPLLDYTPPKSWGVGPHVKNLRNLYVFFWRWAAWKVFDSVPREKPGIISFITAAGWLDGDGFQQMRARLREQATDIYVIECSPEGHQAAVSTRIFQQVQHAVCIVMAVRRPDAAPGVARVLTRSLAAGSRKQKFAELLDVRLDDGGWTAASDHPRAPYVALDTSDWSTYPAMGDLFTYDGSGVMIGRTWPVAPDAETLTARVKHLLAAENLDVQRGLFLEHPTDRRVDKRNVGGLPGYADRQESISESDSLEAPVRYSFRSLDRQWVIPDKRLINRPNPSLWAAAGRSQVYMTAPRVEAPHGGPAVSLAASPPDMDHYGNRGGRVYPLRFPNAETSNIRSKLLSALESAFGKAIDPDDVFFYAVGIVSHSGYVSRFKAQLSRPGVRVPFTVDVDLFNEVATLGRQVSFLHTYGTRGSKSDYATSSGGSPRLPADRAPHTLAAAPMPSAAEDFPNELTYDAASEILYVGKGGIGNVTPAIRDFEIDGTRIIDRWFSSRKSDRAKPPMQNRRESKLDGFKPNTWLPEYTADLIDLLNVIGLLVDLEPSQADALDRVLAGGLIDGLVPDPYADQVSTSAKSAEEELRAAQFGAVSLAGFEELDGTDQRSRPE
ncbi:type ISP restriction/modification enzyme [Microbacterium gorillae]|uniref:type ISP restriction/modification enzyme n=1 Tax=Microbacterium gorillae TaxID=1231063 RepID=UPI003D96B9D8